MRILSALAVTLAPALALATADGPDAWRVTGVAADDVLNLRAGPAARAPKLAGIPPDADGLPNLGCIGRMSFAEWEAATEAERARAARRVWCLTGYGTTIGWAAGWYLAEGSDRGGAWQGGAAIFGRPVGHWRLEHLGGEPLPDGVGASLTFAAAPRVEGFTGCDKWVADHAPEGGAGGFRDLTFPTRNKCLPEKRAVSERMIAALRATERVVATAAVLSLIDGDNRVLATFMRRKAN